MKKFLLITAACVIAASCAKTTTTSTGEEAQEYLKVYLATFYPGLTANADGLYMMEDIPGTGAAWDKSHAYSYVETTIRTLSGTISSTTDEALSKQLGTYAFGNYYGPKYSATGEGNSYAGVDALLQGMRVGGTRTAIIPSWLLTTSRYNTKQEYLDACTSSTHLIYTIKLCGQCDDVLKTQADSLSRYVHRLYGDGVTFVRIFENEDYDGQFFFISDTTAFKDVTPRETTASLKLNYTGRLLNGQVFDTTIENVAKDAGIYNSGRTYSTQSVTFSGTYTDISMGNSTSLIKGFQLGLYKMHWSGQKAVIGFTSNWGYDTSGSGQAIPSYSPLIFELELL